MATINDSIYESWNKPLDEDFSISIYSSNLPIYESPARIYRVIVWLCVEGWADLEINSIAQRVVKNEIRILFPNQILSLDVKSPDFAIMYFSFSPTLLTDILFRFPPYFVGFLKENFHRELPADAAQMVQNNTFRTIKRKFDDTTNVCRREIVLNLIRNFFLETYDKNIKELTVSGRPKQRRHELVERFCDLVMAHYRENREVAFYADKLHITPKYLSVVLRQESNKTAKQWIDNYVATEIKLLLRSTHWTIQEISYYLHFPNQSFLCKYFKSQVGVTPTEYRDT